MSKYKLVEVFDGVKWFPRNVLFFNGDGSVIAVGDEEEQLDDDYILKSTTFFAKHREIKKPTWKPFPNNESMEHLKDCWFRFKNSTQEFRTAVYNSDDVDDVFRFNDGWWTKEEVFDQLEVQINGTWQPVGVEE